MTLTDELTKTKLKRRRKPSSLTPQKAREMLRDGTAHGRPLTAAQRRMLYWRAGDNHW